MHGPGVAGRHPDGEAMRYLLLIRVDPSHLPSPDFEAGRAMFEVHAEFTS
jgi:hypothetical protein